MVGKEDGDPEGEEVGAEVGEGVGCEVWDSINAVQKLFRIAPSRRV